MMMSKKLINADFQHQITALWSSFLLALLFHTQLGLMPMFHGMEITHSHADEFVNPDFVFWFMFLFFAFPVLAIALTPFTSSRLYRKLHFGLTLIYSVLNFAHLTIDIMIKVPSYQIVLMVILFALGIALNIVSWQWMRHGHRAMHRGELVKQEG
jgi:glucan phosphoethanolaminetransferase (alkaline phosphatase superfamily)